ncbi:hypothetical protein CsSME_00037751 [Camellia sinensis var. sinensis]
MADFKGYYNYYYYLCVFVILTTTTSCSKATTSPSDIIKGAYWPSGASDLHLSSIDTTLFTHTNYACLSPNNVTSSLTSQIQQPRCSWTLRLRSM